MSQLAREGSSARRAGDHAGSERSCAVTRVVLPPDELIRFVLAPDGRVFPDLARKLTGRGVWLTCSRAVVETACKSGSFAKSLRRSVIVPDDLPDLVEELLTRRSIEGLSLANKAGLVVTGFVKTDAAIGSGQCAAILHAGDASDDGAGKLDRKFRAVWREQSGQTDPPIVTCLTSADLSLAMGRSNVVHAALAHGGAGSHFLRAAGRLQRYRASSSVPARSPEAGGNTEKA